MPDAQPPSPLKDAELTASRLDFPIVALGASAGGLQALMSFFSRMPADCGMAFVVVLHLSPRHASNLGPLLQGVTALAVLTPEQPVAVERNHVYVIPPNKQLSMNDGYLRVTDLDPVHGKHTTIDILFRTLAMVHKTLSFAVVLSGNGSDGAVGLTRIKEEGGVTLAQAPHDAEFDGMPRAAIETGAVDWVLPVELMPQKLLDIWANARSIELPEPAEAGSAEGASRDAARLAEEALRDVLNLLRTRTGHDFRSYKRATLLRRLERRMQVQGVPNLPAYLSLMQAQADEAGALLKDLLIGVTNFFRDPEAFEVLEREVLAPLMQRTDPATDSLRAWVAGCSTGEEAYSLAMLLCEQAGRIAHPPKVHIFATDIDDDALATARLGSYPVGIEADVPPGRLHRFFDKEDSRYRIRKEVREKVMFAAHNILRDPPFSRLDLISCRNLLIYLDRDIHAQVLEVFHFALKPGGYLFLGSSESAESANQLFSVVDKKNRIFRANAVARSPRYLPTLPMGLTYTAVPAPAAAEPRAEKRPLSHGELHQRLAQQYAPPSVLVDAAGEIVHMTERAGHYLRHGGGTPSHQLLSLVHPQLRLELRTALFQAVRTGRSVEAQRVRLSGDGPDRYVTMIVRPVQAPEAGGQLAMVVFDEVEDSMAAESRVPETGARDPLLAQLEEELRRTKEQLQNTIEQYETSNEELKASNEELQAINEELRSTTEELETSKEELQSINEELVTVNQELKAKIEETAKINDDLQNLIASTDIATVFVDRAMNIKRFTPQATRLFNLIPSDVGRSLMDITHRLDYEALADDAAEAFKALRVIEREVCCSDGRWYLARLLPYRTTEDRIDGAVLTFVDITMRRKAEENLRLVAESAKDYAIVTTDAEGRITTWNRGAERIFGHREGEVLGHPISLLFTPEDIAAGVPEQELRHAREHGRAEDDRWHQRKDGTRFFCSGITTPLYDHDVLCGYGKIARDLTGLKRSESDREAQLQREMASRAEAQAASELKDEFLAVMSHELKNPLNLIQLNAELLMRAPEARDLPVVARAAGVIRRSVQSQAQIIDDLLDLSRLNTGKLALKRRVVDWADSVRLIAEAVGEDAAHKRVSLAVQIPDEPVLIDADPVRLEQIVWNLLSNALKFTPTGGGITVRLTHQGDDAQLVVEDNGLGIGPELLPHVFDMFKQAETSTARRHGGLGIGLALVKSLALAHGGRVEAQSPGVGQGARFTVSIPLEAPHPPGTAPRQDAGPGELAHCRALVLDDDPQALDALRQLLEFEGAAVVTAGSAGEALARLEREGERFDVIISDIAMPGMDGYQFAQAAKALPAHAGVPLVALTGLGRPADAKRVIAAGFAAHVKKPVTLEKLLAALTTVWPQRADSGTTAA